MGGVLWLVDLGSILNLRNKTNTKMIVEQSFQISWIPNAMNEEVTLADN